MRTILFFSFGFLLCPAPGHTRGCARTPPLLFVKVNHQQEATAQVPSITSLYIEFPLVLGHCLELKCNLETEIWALQNCDGHFALICDYYKTNGYIKSHE